MQPWTYTSVFTDDHGLLCVCVCVREYISNHGLPLPLRKSMVGTLFTCMPMRFANDWRLSDNRGRPWLVCVHGYTEIFRMCVHGCRCLQNAHTHTHTNRYSEELHCGGTHLFAPLLNYQFTKFTE